ncbi:hypothetical protein J7E97_26450 [Streptomyces sp. ISL-66]|uniref:hypothetical protein n=1 Tax=Streptomyces sp. ISL-66 TaxID=2819186 RepID=UPI001BE94722|nr:hypothetical protein [Streptomyces sp. ISL-66]MBT2471305.1 hypothetical protein [Streptomyces sp. ISL-66]
MNPSQNAPADAGPGASATPHPALASALGLIALAISLIAVAMSFADHLGTGGTAALIGADLVLVGAMGALLATLRAQPAPVPAPACDVAPDGTARRVRDEELLDALEPLAPARGTGGEGR